MTMAGMQNARPWAYLYGQPDTLAFPPVYRILFFERYDHLEIVGSNFPRQG